VAGDVAGSAAVTLRDVAGGCEVRLTSALAPDRGVLHLVAALAPPLARFGHDWVLANGADQLTELLAGPAPVPATGRRSVV
jgi:hypothetical protein